MNYSPEGAAAMSSKRSVAPPGLELLVANIPQVKTWGYSPMSLRDYNQKGVNRDYRALSFRNGHHLGTCPITMLSKKLRQVSRVSPATLHLSIFSTFHLSTTPLQEKSCFSKCLTS